MDIKITVRQLRKEEPEGADHEEAQKNYTVLLSAVLIFPQTPFLSMLKHRLRFSRKTPQFLCWRMNSLGILSGLDFFLFSKYLFLPRLPY